MFYNAFNKRMMTLTNNILMIRPVSFRYNEATAVNNYYQKNLAEISMQEIHKRAVSEFDALVVCLKDNGINVIVVDDTKSYDTPDSIFPNNWVSFHVDGTVVLYPMYATNRRNERREDILDILTNSYGFKIAEVKDFSILEKDEKFLEGTGSMVLDRKNRICYAAISIRTHKEVVIKFCKEFNYKPICFTANQNVGNDRMNIYHTNVMMCVADNFVVICLDSIDKESERKHVLETLINTGKEIIEITEEQKNKFAGNMLQVMGDKSHLIMSESAFNVLTTEQKRRIERYSSIIYSSLDTIESCGGGSARCMMAEVFLPKDEL